MGSLLVASLIGCLLKLPGINGFIDRLFGQASWY